MQALSIAFLVSFLFSILILKFNRYHVAYSGDDNFSAPQKYHTNSVPRIGGLAIFIGMLTGCGLVYFKQQPEALEFLLLTGIVGLVFIVGLVEDLKKDIGVFIRLFFMILASYVAIFYLGTVITRVNLPWFDYLLAFPACSIIFTVFSIVGMTNSVNIIDGYHGLASVVCIMIFLALAYVGYLVDDRLVWTFCAVLIGAVLGFLIWNYPRGLIFLGDGGAYLLGFSISLASILLIVRNPQVSAWYPLLLVMYPVTETIFSIYRKWFLRGLSPLQADGIHLHMLIYKRLVRWAVGPEISQDRRNANTAPYLWLLASIGVFPAIVFWSQEIVLQFFVIIYVVLYIYLYKSLIRFKTPAWFRKK